MFVTEEELKRNIDSYENWSKMCIDNISSLVSDPPSTNAQDHSFDR